jgi:hypothetical protein
VPSGERVGSPFRSYLPVITADSNRILRTVG